MIESHSLTKRYGGRTAVQDVSFTCETGTVTGFLGPNGAGKSTTLKMLCGLTPASSGRSTVLGSPFANLTNPGRRVGVLIDASAQHAGRTGHETLAVSASIGWVAADPRHEDPTTLLVRADREMYRRKSARNRSRQAPT